MSATMAAAFANKTDSFVGVEAMFEDLSDYARTDREFWHGSLRRAFKADESSRTDDHATGYTETGRQLLAEGITTTEPRSQELNDQIENLLAAAREASVREELEEQFACEMNSALSQYGDVAIGGLADRILSGKVGPDVAADVLDLIGRIEHGSTYRHRRWLLERALTSPYLRVRHGASLGIAYLRDPHSIRYLKSAIEFEPVDELKEKLQEILTYVEIVR